MGSSSVETQRYQLAAFAICLTQVLARLCRSFDTSAQKSSGRGIVMIPQVSDGHLIVALRDERHGHIAKCSTAALLVQIECMPWIISSRACTSRLLWTADGCTMLAPCAKFMSARLSLFDGRIWYPKRVAVRVDSTQVGSCHSQHWLRCTV